jgi:copper(I)-binding protein
MYKIVSIALLLTVIVVLSACGAAEGSGLRVEEAWARPAMAAPGTGAVFMRLVNDGPQADRLLAGQTDVAAVVEIHETVLEGEVMKMQMLPEGLEIPAGDEVALRPGGYHVMLIGVRDDLEIGQRFELDLQFERAGTVTFEVEVRQP